MMLNERLNTNNGGENDKMKEYNKKKKMGKPGETKNYN